MDALVEVISTCPIIGDTYMVPAWIIGYVGIKPILYNKRLTNLTTGQYSKKLGHSLLVPRRIVQIGQNTLL